MKLGRVESLTLEDIITIELFGQPYSFKAETDAKLAKKVADLLVQEVESVENELSGKQAKLNKFTILMLAALNIANESAELKQNYADLRRNISEKTVKMMKTIDVHLQ
jgi:cell division protein ZapA (FtsZ GTPase activity inhibitor)